MEKNLQKFRLEIDNIDTQLIELISKRIETVKKVGEIKKQNKNIFYVPERESSIINKLSKKFPHIENSIIEKIITEVISSCRNYEKQFNIAVEHDVLSLSALRNIFGSFFSFTLFENSNLIDLDKTDFIFTKLDNNFIELVENNKNIFIINYINFNNVEFVLLSKKINEIENSNSFFLIKNNFDKVENSFQNMYNYTYDIIKINDNFSLIKLSTDKIEKFEEFKNFLFKNNFNFKYLGDSPK